jgi:hypothetical protein
MYRFERQYLTGMAAQTVVVIGHDPPMGFMTLIAVQPCHGYSLGESGL